MEFKVKDLGTVPTKKDQIACCWLCGHYGKQSEMVVVGKRNVCIKH